MPFLRGEIMYSITGITYIGGKQVLSYDGLSTDTKPLNTTDSKIEITNGSTYFEMDTGNVFKFDQENITADIDYSKAKKLVAGLQSGFDHATETKNADGTVTMTMYFTNGTNVPLTFPKPNDGEKGDDGASVISASVKNKHLILTKDDGTDIDCGLLPTSDYDDTELRTAIDGKVDKVTGKSLVDDAEIARLANVDNYDDTAIKATIKTVSDGLMASAGYSADYKTIDIVTVGGDKKSIDVKPVIEHANIGELADVDSTNKGNGKALVFN